MKMCKAKNMFFWFNRRKRRDEFSQRSPMSNEEFIEKINFSEGSKIIQCYRSTLGKMSQVPADRIYPDDTFGALSQLAVFDWDILGVILPLEDVLEVELDEEKIPNWNQKVTVGQWIKDLLLRCSV